MNERCSACNGMKQVYFNVDTDDGSPNWHDMWVSEFEEWKKGVDNRMGVIHIAKVVCLGCGILYDGSGMV